MTGLLIALAITVGLLALGYLVGSWRERRHLISLDAREQEMASMLVLDTKKIPPGITAVDGRLVMGEVVIAADYFKTFAAGLRNLIGGEVRTYQTMLSRARREARLRMLEAARALGATTVINIRFQWSDVGPNVPSAEMFCYGTAVVER